MADGGKPSAYHVTTELDSLADLASRLQEDVRKDLRAMKVTEVMGPAWGKIVETATRMGEVTDMVCGKMKEIRERELPKKSDDATLWECEEATLRFILEDAKLVLLVRLVESFEDYMEANSEEWGDMDVGAGVVKGLVLEGGAGNTLEAQLSFESGMGATLRNAWLHSEAVHVSDVPLVFQTIARGLALRLGYVSQPEAIRSLAKWGLLWIDSFASQIDVADQDAVVREADRSGALVYASLTMLAVLNAISSSSTSSFPTEEWREVVLQACRGLGKIMSSEAWLVQVEDAVASAPPTGGPTLGAALLELDKAFLEQGVKMGKKGAGPKWRPFIRAIRDTVTVARRKDLFDEEGVKEAIEQKEPTKKEVETE